MYQMERVESSINRFGTFTEPQMQIDLANNKIEILRNKGGGIGGGHLALIGHLYGTWSG